MRAALSVIIPTLNAAPGLPSCLAALMEGLEAGLIRELIISDGGSTDATLQIAEEVGAQIITGPPSRGGQIKRGIAAAQGDWLLVLHADTLLSPGWSKLALAHLNSPQAACFRLGFDAAGLAPRMVAGWANLRTRAFGLPYGDQGLLIPRALHDRIGGYRDIALMEDVAIARALRGQITVLPVTARTSAARYAQAGWVRRGCRNLWTLTRFLCGADPDALAQAYRR
ncbi:TIGR04283 family arsenosugar biosynthesis glycosyltransferase [Thalassobius taeanensis]|uniref:Glycosyltransferase 2-like domain-containing protein n=1 Tax=Thalassovita taeanensis TaxID=657014 RepID=A0A1H9FFJ9_9RHOB|nr:hypothetical protein SAMN04488092_10660 [Thalassovita taeanensis]